MSLLDRIAETLRTAHIPFAVIGAAAMATHGVGRSTRDQDLLALDTRCLQLAFWTPLQEPGVTVEVHKGDAFDPLAGVVRFEEKDELPVDLVVGKFTWQREVLGRAMIAPDGLPVVTAADLILLKLYAGGPQDAWDIQQMLAVEDREALVAQVDTRLPDLSAEAAALWRRILEG